MVLHEFIDFIQTYILIKYIIVSLAQFLDPTYQINYPPFVLNGFTDPCHIQNGQCGTMANSVIAKSGMQGKQNATFMHKQKFSIDLMLCKTKHPLPGHIGIIPIKAIKAILKGEEILVKYCAGSTGYFKKVQAYGAVPPEVRKRKPTADEERDKRACKRAQQKELLLNQLI